jgi:hypothetical protein
MKKRGLKKPICYRFATQRLRSACLWPRAARRQQPRRRLPDAGWLGAPKLGRPLNKPTPIAKARTTQTEAGFRQTARPFVSKKDEPDATPSGKPAATVALFVQLASIKGRLRAQWVRAALVCPSSFQCELFAKFGRDGLGAFLNGFGMLGRGNHRSAPAEDRLLANRHIHAASQQLLMNHILKFGTSFLLACQTEGLSVGVGTAQAQKFTLGVA